MATRTRRAAHDRLAASAAPQASPFAGNVPGLGQEDFKKRFAAWLKDHEKDRPFHEVRELEERIKRGELKLKTAEQRGVSADDGGYKAAVAKLAELKARRVELTKTAQVPFLAFNTAHIFLRASRGWDLPTGSYLEIHLPGLFSVRVDVAESEIPF